MQTGSLASWEQHRTTRIVTKSTQSPCFKFKTAGSRVDKMQHEQNWENQCYQEARAFHPRHNDERAQIALIWFMVWNLKGKMWDDVRKLRLRLLKLCQKLVLFCLTFKTRAIRLLDRPVTWQWQWLDTQNHGDNFNFSTLYFTHFERLAWFWGFGGFDSPSFKVGVHRKEVKKWPHRLIHICSDWFHLARCFEYNSGTA